MEQLPISAHIVVVNHSSGKSPVSNANTLPAEGAEGSFADRLAEQISAQGTSGSGEVNPPVALAVEVASPKVEAQAAQQLAETLSTLSLPYLPITQSVDGATSAGKESKSAPRLSLIASVVAGLTPEGQAASVAAIKPAVIRDVAAKGADESAIIAVTDKALPSKHALDFDVLAGRSPLPPSLGPTTARLDFAPLNTATAPYVPLTVDVKVGTPGWDTAFSQRVAWAATNQHQVAELRLNPPNLGPIEIRITVSNDQATAIFVSAHASVRDSIEAALPKLREMLAESGLTLGNVNVSSQSFQQQQQQAGQDEDKSKSQQGGFIPELALTPALPMNIDAIAVGRNGLVDIFA